MELISDKLLACYPDLVNIVTIPTHGNKILDVIVTDLHPWYDKAVVSPPIQPDLEGRGRPSDHAVAVARPKRDGALRTGFSRKETKYSFQPCYDWSLPCHF